MKYTLKQILYCCTSRDLVREHACMTQLITYIDIMYFLQKVEVAIKRSSGWKKSVIWGMFIPKWRSINTWMQELYWEYTFSVKLFFQKIEVAEIASRSCKKFLKI